MTYNYNKNDYAFGFFVFEILLFAHLVSVSVFGACGPKNNCSREKEKYSNHSNFYFVEMSQRNVIHVWVHNRKTH